MHFTTSVAAAAALVNVAAAVPHYHNIAPRSQFRVEQVSTGRTVARNGAGALKKAYLKYSKTIPSPVEKAAAAQSGTVTTTPTADDEEYITPVTVGNESLNLDFDTGSADLWVFSSELPRSEQSGHSIYEVNSAKVESGERWSITYGDGSGAAGNVYADTVVVGGVTATSQAVEAATSISSSFQQDTSSDGLLGLAFSSINTVTPRAATTFFDTVKSSLAKPLFTADLKKGAPGIYTFGYIDTSAYTGSITYTDVTTEQGFWEFTANGYSVGGGSTKSANIDAIADTGTTLLLIDDSIVSAYYRQVSGAQNSESAGGYVFPCGSTLPSFGVEIGGTIHTVPGTDINYAPNGDGTCFGGIQSNEGIGFSILGDIFLKSQYVVFDSSVPRIGFAQQS
ncbi:MAG: Type I transmembrane sorting receptor [Bathelium mastoideum]|nr:MAG: Type I transmembrane sorting receptor [Bathelium mastoideum]KAI9690260.1 MAG: Type I transmembrane sorting receptor [Bathelium mastoideum]